MSNLRLTFASGPYDRTMALREGTIRPEGIELNYLTMQPAEIFWRMLQYQEFDASEMSLSNYTTLVSGGNAPFIAIPVFPSRVFRHGYFFINTTKGIAHPRDLKGKRGGVPEYSMTAAVYMRGLLQHEYGVKPSDVEWVQGRADRLGRKLPPDIHLTQAPAGSELGDLLERGEIDFLMTDAHRGRGLRGERPAMHLGAAGDRRAAVLRPLSGSVRRRHQEAQGRRPGGRRHRRRPDGEQRGRRTLSATGRRRGRQGRQAGAQADPPGRHPGAGDRRRGATRRRG